MKKITSRTIVSTLHLLISVNILILNGRSAIADIANKNVINGLFAPTASQQFFEEGQENFDRETTFLNNSELYFEREILQIDPALMQKMKKTKLKRNSLNILHGNSMNIDSSTFMIMK